jgi:hypothetical protein
VALRAVEGSSGLWREWPLAGSLERLTVRSQLLDGNPPGDPAVRPLYVYRPPDSCGGGEPLPSIYMLQGFGGRLQEWLVVALPVGRKDPRELGWFFAGSGRTVVDRSSVRWSGKRLEGYDVYGQQGGLASVH